MKPFQGEIEAAGNAPVAEFRQEKVE